MVSMCRCLGPFWLRQLILLVKYRLNSLRILLKFLDIVKLGSESEMYGTGEHQQKVYLLSLTSSVCITCRVLCLKFIVQ
jgi:hypothetical protein